MSRTRAAHRGCAPSRRDRLSQLSGFGENPLLQVRTQSADGHDFNSPSKQFLELLFEADHVEQRTIWLHFDKQVDIAVGAVVSPQDRAKHADIADAVTGRHRDDLMPPRSQLFD